MIGELPTKLNNITLSGRRLKSLADNILSVCFPFDHQLIYIFILLYLNIFRVCITLMYGLL